MPERHEHPIPRLAHAFLDLLNDPRLDAALREGVVEMAADSAAIAEYVTVQESNLHVRCQESLDDGREITRLRTKLGDACALAEARLTVEAARYERANADFLAANRLAQVLSDESIRPYSITLHGPQSAAGGR